MYAAFHTAGLAPFSSSVDATGMPARPARNAQCRGVSPRSFLASRIERTKERRILKLAKHFRGDDVISVGMLTYL